MSSPPHLWQSSLLGSPPPSWTTSAEAYGHSHRRPLGASHSLGSLDFGTSSQRASRFNPYAQSSSAIGSFSPPPAKPVRASVPAPPSDASATADALGRVNLAAERARFAHALARQPSATFEPAAYRPDSAALAMIERGHVTLRRALYHPM
jgi:hypothetical protein